MIKSSKIRNMLSVMFPLMSKVWLTDEEYLLPSYSEVVDRINKFWPEMDYVDNISECDKFSLFLHSDIQKSRAKEALTLPYDQRLAWPFGECFAKRLQGSDYIHALNVFICCEGIYLVDAVSKEIRIAEKNNDILFFIRM